jgi:hypothetical protein
VAVWLYALRTRSDAGTPDYLRAADQVASGLGDGGRWSVVGGEFLQVPEALCGVLTDQKAPWLNLLPTAFIGVGLVAAVGRRRWLVALPVVGSLGFLTIWGRGAMDSRYLLPVLPLVAYLLLDGALTVAAATGRWSGVDERTRNRRQVVAVAAAAAVCLAVSLPKDVRQIWWMRQASFYKAFEGGSWQQYVDAAAYLRSRSSPGDAVLTPRWTIVHYLSRLRVIDQPLEGKHTAANAAKIPPARFAEAAADCGARFVVVRTGERGWSEAALASLAATGVFRTPPTEFGRLAVFERISPP